MGKSEIEWTDWSWNILGGCTEKSLGCANCYARRMSWRMMHNPKAPARYQGTVEKVDGDLRWTGQVNLDWEALRDPEPLRVKTPKRIFVASMSDLFHPAVPDRFIDVVFGVMALARQHQFVVLTKRADRMMGYMLDLQKRAQAYPGRVCRRWPLSNVIGMVTAENQVQANARVAALLHAPFAYRGVSLEPLLGPVDLRHIQTQEVEVDALSGNHGVWHPFLGRSERRLHWVIAGGETGPGARPMDPDWARTVRDQCKTAQVPFFFKSWGAWVPSDQDQAPSGVHEPGRWHEWNSGLFSYRVGKQAAGRALDGEVWDEVPEMDAG